MLENLTSNKLDCADVAKIDLYVFGGCEGEIPSIIDFDRDFRLYFEIKKALINMGVNTPIFYTTEYVSSIRIDAKGYDTAVVTYYDGKIILNYGDLIETYQFKRGL